MIDLGEDLTEAKSYKYGNLLSRYNRESCGQTEDHVASGILVIALSARITSFKDGILVNISSGKLDIPLSLNIYIILLAHKLKWMNLQNN